MNLSTVFAIQTQGGANIDRWVSTFRIEYSQDCANFSRVLDLAGNTQVRLCVILFLLLTFINMLINIAQAWSLAFIVVCSRINRVTM